MKINHFGLDRQYIGLRDQLLDATDRVLRTGHLISAQYTDEFEQWLANKTKAKYALTCHSGTQALEIMAVWRRMFYIPSHNGMIKNPTVRLPNLTYPATFNAWSKAGWEVELVDTDKNGLMKFSTEAQQCECTVGLYGAAPVVYKDPLSLMLMHNRFVDGAQHWLVTDGDVGTGMAISFDPTKNLPASGNGGAIVTNSQELYDTAKNYVNNGKDYNYTVIGTNSRMSEQECAQILVRTQYIDQWQARRKEIADFWCERFADLPLRCLSAGVVRHAHQKFVVYLTNRIDLLNHLTTAGIDAKIHYPYTLSQLPMSRKIINKPDLISTSSMLSMGVLSLPMYPELTDTEVEYIANTIKGFYDN